MSSELVSLDFAPDIARLKTGFTGRTALLQTLGGIFDQRQERFVLLTGEPGVGKSAVCARLLEVRPEICAHHFCFARRASTITPATVIRSLVRQLGDRLPGFEEALLKTLKPLQLTLNISVHLERAAPGSSVTGLVIHHMATKNADEDFEILIRAPLAAMPASTAPIILLIDGLDEALSYSGNPNLVEILSTAHGLPAWVTLFCSSRRTATIMSHLEPCHPCVVDADALASRPDVSQYAVGRVSSGPLHNRLTALGANQSETLARVEKWAAGNFLCAVTVLDALEHGQLSPAAMDELPPDLNAIYRLFMRRFSDEEWETKYQPLLGRLAVAQEPLTENMLAAMTALPPSRVLRALRGLDQYLSALPLGGKQVGYELFHESFREFLLSKTAAGEYWCNPDEEHDAVARSYLHHAATDWGKLDDYALRHVPLHLAKAGRTAELVELLTDAAWLAAKLGRTSVSEILIDFRLAEKNERIEAVAAIVRLSAFALERDKDQLLPELENRSFGRPSPVVKFPASPGLRPLKLLTPTVRQFDDPLLWVFHGHQVLVKAVCAIPGTLLVVSGSSDCTVRVWDLEAGREVRRFEGHTNVVTSLAVSADRTRVFSGSRDQTVRIWDWASGRCLRVLPNLGGEVEGLSLSSNGEYLAVETVSLKRPSTLLIFEGANLTPRRPISRPDGIGAVAFVPGRTWLAERSREGVRVWDVVSGVLIRELPYVHQSVVFSPTALAISPDGRVVAVGGTAGGEPLKVFDLTDGSSFLLPTDRQGVTTRLAYSPDGYTLLCVGKPWQILPENNLLDDFVRVWDVRTRTCRARFPHDGILQAVTVSADNRFAISAAGNGKISVWRLDRRGTTLSGHSGEVVAVRVRAGRALSASIDGTLCAWNLNTRAGTVVARSQLPLTAMDASADGSLLLASGWEYSIVDNNSVFSSEVRVHRSRMAGKPIALVNETRGLNLHSYTALAFLPGDRRVVLARHAPDQFDGGTQVWLELWDVKKASRLAAAECGRAPVRSILALRGVASVFTVAQEICRWSTDDLQPGPQVILPGAAASRCAALSPNENLLALGAQQGRVEVWDLKSEKRLATYLAHETPVNDLVFLGDSGHIASVADDHRLRICAWSTGQTIASFFADTALRAVDYDAILKVIVAGDDSGKVHFLKWENPAL